MLANFEAVDILQLEVYRRKNTFFKRILTFKLLLEIIVTEECVTFALEKYSEL